MIIVVHPDHLLYHPVAPASAVEDRLVLKMFMFWMADIIVINTTSQKGSTVTISWLKFLTNTDTLHVNNPLNLMVAPLASHEVILVQFSNWRRAVMVAQSVRGSLVRISTEATFSGWTHMLRYVSRYHLMSFIEINVVGTDMSQVRPLCR